MGLKPSRAKAPLPIQETETGATATKDKQELANDRMDDCTTLLEHHSLLDRLMEWDHGLPAKLRSAHLPESYREALEHLHGEGRPWPEKV